VLLAVWRTVGVDRPLTVADIGCGPGTLAMAWAEAGHHARGLDINQKLIEFARRTAAERHLDVGFDLGSATELPWPDGAFDICIMPELLEHVRDWPAVLSDCARVVGRPGLLFLSTTNRMCPLQNEFNLPGFSWYPGPLKRHYIRLAETTRPELANYAKYPAYNWFTVGELREHLRGLGFTVFFDRFDLAALARPDGVKGAALNVVTRLGPARWLGQFEQIGHLLKQFALSRAFSLPPFERLNGIALGLINQPHPITALRYA